MQSFLIVALGLAILTVVFALQNTVPVVVTFLIWKFEGSLAMVLMLTFALGVLVSSLVSIPAIVKRRSATSNQKKKMRSWKIDYGKASHRRGKNYATGNNKLDLFTPFADWYLSPGL
jgi:putative membrane protein